MHCIWAGSKPDVFGGFFGFMLVSEVFQFIPDARLHDADVRSECSPACRVSYLEGFQTQYNVTDDVDIMEI